MKKLSFIQLLTILVFLAFFLITFMGYYNEATDIVKTGAGVFGTVFEKLVEFFTLDQ